jgi:hypothetical protein
MARFRLGMEPVAMALVVVAILAFFANSWLLRFTQDDAYITFRYARNLNRGDGLVFNAGERVEGYTNFLWTLMAALTMRTGQNPALLASVLGVLFSAVVLWLMVAVGRAIEPSRPPLLLAVAPLLLAANGSFAYWSTSGLETALFTLLITLGVWLHLRWQGSGSSPLGMAAAFALATMTRPEGGLFFGITWLHGLCVGSLPRGKRFKSYGGALLVFVALVLPQFIWRLAYYGYPLPNTFYAKTGFSVQYVQAGLAYLWLFLRHYCLGGLVVVASGIALWRFRRMAWVIYLLVLMAGYGAYVVAIGGDVLKVHRFFVPILPVLYLWVQEGIRTAPGFRGSRRLPIVVACLCVLIGVTILVPRSYITYYREQEMLLVRKMTAAGRWFHDHLGEDEWFAATTIGALSYFSDRNLIDMLGLTDETIAHHPEEDMDIPSTWRERNYNTGYVLSRRPRFIYFSTGMKPSAPAELALFTRSDFRHCYYEYYFNPITPAKVWTECAFRLKEPDCIETVRVERWSPQFVDLYVAGIEANQARNFKEGISLLGRAAEEGPPGFAAPYEMIGEACREQKSIDWAWDAYLRAVEMDSFRVTGLFRLGIMSAERGEIERAVHYLRRVLEIDPDHLKAHWSLASTLEEVGRHEEALVEYEAIVNRWPLFTPAREKTRQISSSLQGG